MRKGHFPDHHSQTVSWQSLKDLLPYLMEYRTRVGLALSCLVFAKLANVATPFVLKHIVDALDGKNAIIGVPLALLVAYGAVRLGSVLIGEIRDTLFGRVTERAMRRVGINVFNHLHKLELDFHLNRKTGGLARDIERGTSGISFLLRFMVFNIVPTFLEIGLVFGLFLINYHWWFAAILLISIAIYIAWSVVATEWRTRFIRAANEADSKSNSAAIDSLLNYETVKYFNNEAFEAQRYDSDLADWEEARRKNRLTLFALNGGQAIIISASMTAMMILAAYEVADGAMTLGDFVLVNAFMMQIFMPLNFLGFVYREMKGSLANIENMFALMRQQPSIIDDVNASDLVIAKGEIVFENLSFSYHPDRPILKNLNCVIPAGKKVAFVGNSGAGKSTIMKLLYRFYDPTNGSIFIDQQNIKTVSQSSLRKQIGIVPQDTVLFNETLWQNIRYGDVNASDEQIWQAIEYAYLKEFIEQLPDKEKTTVGERGLKLSGGEKQRVAIARTILKNPSILLFDEATSSLDSHSETFILKAIDSISQNHTSVVIAHRLSTITNADIIFVLQQGEIVEQGAHNDLLNKRGTYFHLWQAQQREEQVESA